MALVMQHVRAREKADCAIVALAMYLGQTYEDVLRATAEVDRKYKGKEGLWETEIKRVAKALGYSLKKKSRVNLDEDHGILCMPNHVTVLKNGLIFDSDGAIWEAEDYLAFSKKEDPFFKFTGVLY